VHIGHLAGVYVPADIYVRYLRLKKREVLFIGGSDEHGVPITVRARKEGITPQDVVDRYHKMIKDSFEEFGISFDIYSRTTSETHHKFAAEWFKKLYDEGKLTEETTEQLYDEEAGADAMINGIKINFTPENIKGEKLTSRAFKEQCVFEFGYLVESEVRIVGGKEKRYQKKTPLSYVLAPAPDNAGGNG
jgi:methionyl-tRNA synthetase